MNFPWKLGRASWVGTACLVGIAPLVAEPAPPLLVTIDTGVDAGSFPGLFAAGESDDGPVTYRDLVEKSSVPIDVDGHGTHLFGIVLRELRSLRQGLLPPLRIYRAGERRMEIPVINLALADLLKERRNEDQPMMVLAAFSFTSGDTTPADLEAFRELSSALLDSGVIMVTAAGNEGKNIDPDVREDVTYPAGLGHRNLLVVASANEDGQLSATSNYGDETVFIAARGARIESAWPGGATKVLSGSSQAAAVVAARVLTLALANDAGADRLAIERVKEELTRQGILHPSLVGRVTAMRYLSSAQVP